ncbi:DNA polymerase III subunit beta [Allokutzneria oryzae]|uniref:DNA polymerase III subunit beta n=1 Tax=Allokutzneria oryzae TaxID=1378989 RepID=A0ABV5ZZH2_9PSEU
MSLDLTADTSVLAAAVADAARLLPVKGIDPLLTGLLLSGLDDEVVLSGTDRENSIRLRRNAFVHTDGQVLVPAKPLADTLGALEEPEVRLVVEGSRLAIRTPGGRFALPLMDGELHPGVGALPAAVGQVNAAELIALVGKVASAASRDDALPLFTGVHVQGRGDRLALVATDRYRMAIGDLPWRPEGELDVLVPAPLLAEVAKQARAAEVITVHADGTRFGLSWPGTQLGTVLLASPYPDESRHTDAPVDAVVEVDGDALAGAVRRVAPYAGPRAVVTVEVGDTELRIRAADPQNGEAEETVKATVDGDRFTHGYQARYLADALRVFGPARLRMSMRHGMRSTVLAVSDFNPEEANLRYVVMPIRMPTG